MSGWMQVVALAAVVGLVPAFAQLSYAQALSEPVVVLPFGEELPDEGLLEVEGEFWHWIVAAAFGLAHAISWTIYDAFFDGEPGFQHTHRIVGSSLLVYSGTFIVGHHVSTVITVVSWFR